LEATHRLFTRIAVPMLLMAAVVACLTLAAIWILQKELEKAELLSKAEIVAAAIESNATNFGSAQELMEYVQEFGLQAAGLKQIALMDVTHNVVIAASVDSWVASPLNRIPQLRDAQGQTRWRGIGAQDYGFSIPVVVQNLSIAEAYSADLLALIIIDGAELVGLNQKILTTLFIVMGAGGGLLFVGAFLLIRRRVLRPIREILQAVQTRTNEQPRPNFPYTYPDEIGKLAEAMDLSFKEIAATNKRVQVMSRAIEGSSNEVYVINVDTLQIVSANLAAQKNLGYELAELLAMRVPDIAAEVIEPELTEKFASQLAHNNEITHCYSHQRKDGTTYPFEFKAVLVEDGQQSVLIVLGNDVSSRLRQEEALRRSEERMKLALEGSNDGVFDFNIAESQIYISEQVRSWLDIDLEEISLEQFLHFVHADDRVRVESGLQTSFADGKDFNVEFRVRSKNETHRWIQVRGQVLFEEGAPVRLSGFASDVTRRKVAENLLQGTVSRLGAVLDHIADGIVTLNEGGEVCTVNPAVLQIFQVEKDELAGTALDQRLTLSEADSAAIKWHEIADGQVRQCEVLRGDGKLVSLEIAVTHMELESDEHYTVVVRDITDRKRHETELHLAMEEAQAATQAKGEFLATMSHEIRTPMNGVLGMTQLLLDMGLSDEQQETAEIILSSGESLLTLINDILDYSKIEAGKLELELVPFDMRGAIKDVMDLLAGSARRKSLDLYVDYPDDEPFAFSADVGRLRQVLINLVGNAIKFTQSGHVVVTIRKLDEDDEGQLLRLAVADTGVGIPENVQGTLFNSFTQADASTTRKFGGTGLGLAICKQLIELMGGDIGITSTQGTGTEIWFKIKLAKSHDVVCKEELPIDLLRKVRLLAVDDNQIGVDIVKGMAESFGMQVVTTKDPLLVPQLMYKAHADNAAFDIVALDYNMPVVDGLTVATNIRDDKNYDKTKIVLLTSSDLNPPSGLDGYALKPLMRRGFARLLLRALYGESIKIHYTGEVRMTHQVSNLRVLLAEDNPVNQRVAVKMLEKLGCRVDVAGNGREAIAMWEQFPYSIIFMDCQMPEMDGLSATQEIREREAGLVRTHTPIIAMTANAMPQDQADCLAAGMDDYASKPIKLNLLGDLVEKWSGMGASQIH